MTFKTTIIAAGALIAASAATVPAAQADTMKLSVHFSTPNASIYFGPGHRDYRQHRRALSAKQVRYLLQRTGFRYVRNLNRQGRVYVVRAVSYNGFLYTVQVHAYSGRIIAKRRIAWVGHGGYGGYGGYDGHGGHGGHRWN